MKNTFTLLAALVLLALHASAQTTRRITAGMNLQTEIDNAQSGDIYIVEGGVQNTNLDIDKKVTIFGTGYFSNATQASTGVAIVSHIRLKPGSDGSYISGLQTLSINISANNVIIKRCYIEGDDNRIRIGYTGLGNGGGFWNGIANNVMILQCYAPRLEWIARAENGITNSSAMNCFIKGNIFYRYGFHIEGTVSGEISNNTFNLSNNLEHFATPVTSTASCWSCAVYPIIMNNNIFKNISQTQNCVYFGNNTPGSACPINANPTGNFKGNVFTQDFANQPIGNVINANPDELFVGYPNNPNFLSPDARAQLAPNSPAKGAGVGGTDAGAFGGSDPYMLGGLPEIPSIYQLTVPQSVPQGGTLQVQIKAKSGN